MAQKDYVTRGQKKRPVAKKKQHTPTPWFKISIAVLLLAGFAYGLWYLNTASTLESSSKPSKAVEVKQIEVEQEALPVLEEEQWEFIEGLPEYSVEVDQQEYESNKEYQMQCGSFRKQSQAQELKANIAFAGLSSQVLKSNGKNGVWYRVVLGPYENKRAAERDRHTLRNQRVNHCKIWYWN